MTAVRACLQENIKKKNQRFRLGRRNEVAMLGYLYVPLSGREGKFFSLLQGQKGSNNNTEKAYLEECAAVSVI